MKYLFPAAMLTPLLVFTSCPYQLPTFDNPVDPLGSNSLFDRGPEDEVSGLWETWTVTDRNPRQDGTTEWTITCVHDHADGEFGSEVAPDGSMRWFRHSTGGSGPSAVRVAIPMYMALNYAERPQQFLPNDPLATTAWSGDVRHGDFTGWFGEVTATIAPDPVTVAAGTFHNVLQLETIVTGTGTHDETGEPAGSETDRFVRGNRHIYLAEGVGIVRLEYRHENGAITRVELETYSVQPSDSYFPQALGDEWEYYWEHIP